MNAAELFEKAARAVVSAQLLLGKGEAIDASDARWAVEQARNFAQTMKTLFLPNA